MDTTQQKQKSVMDRIWEEITSVSGPHYQPQLVPGRPSSVPSFGGRVSTVEFGKPHPFDHPPQPMENNPEHSR